MERLLFSLAMAYFLFHHKNNRLYNVTTNRVNDTSTLHHIPGRLRLRCHGSVKMVEERLLILRTLIGIQQCDLNVRTASIVIRYDPAIVQSEKIFALCQLDKNTLASSLAEGDADWWRATFPTANEEQKISPHLRLGKNFLSTIVQQWVEHSVFSVVTAMFK